MKTRLAMTALLLIAAGTSVRADEYAVDSSHAAAVFRISHVGLSWTYGRFKDLSGSFTIDSANPSNTRFELIAKVDSLDTDNAKRDEHLKSPDFFNAKQFPLITFKSTSVKPIEDGFEVTGDMTIHGETKPVTIVLKGGKTIELPKGVQRTGYSTEFKIKRSDFGMNQALQMIGDDVFIQMSFEGTKK